MQARASLRRLLDVQPCAALGTLHGEDPAVSMVPIALLRPQGEAARFVIHISALATHTRDLQRHPRASLMVTADPEFGVIPQARPRVSFQVDAAELPKLDKHYKAAKKAYLDRFPDAREIFDLGDFALWSLLPQSARLVAGFGRAYGLVAEPLAEWLAA